jgi:hypothetical protein
MARSAGRIMRALRGDAQDGAQAAAPAGDEGKRAP